MINQLVDLNHEFKITPFMQGIKLLKPDLSNEASPCISDMENKPFNVYFLNKNSEIQYVNSESLFSIRVESLKECIGQSVFKKIDNEFAYKVRNNDLTVVKNKKMLLVDEEGTITSDYSHLSSLSIKMPWYDHHNKIIGIFGYGIILGTHSLAQSINQIIAINNFSLLSSQNISNHTGKVLNDIYFTKREIDILNNTARGRTAKETATILGLSKRTVEHYLENIKTKMGAVKKSDMIDKYLGLNLSKKNASKIM